MPLNTREIMTVCSELASQENLRVCVSQSTKGACIAGGCALAGSLLGGPLGLAIGGTIGSIGAAWKAKGQYKSVAEVILYDMTKEQQEQLGLSVRNVINDLTAEDVVTAVALITSDGTLEQLVLKVIRSYVQDNMGLATIL